MTPYWHRQRLFIAELGVSVARGIAPGLGVGVSVPLRTVRDRIRFEDLAGHPYVPPEPDTHHRNETLVRVADPQVTVLVTRVPGAWTLAAGVGTTVPVGRTESNPFALGRLGLPHQHIQFGTGTWDPVLQLAASRATGAFGIDASASGKASVTENDRGYRAGSRWGVRVGANRKLGATWGVNAGVGLDREYAEKWSGRIEEEGNLGRTDLTVSAGAGRGVHGIGSFGLRIQAPIKTWATGEQVKIPLVVSLGWNH